MGYPHKPCMLQSGPKLGDAAKQYKISVMEPIKDVGGENVALHLPLPSAQLSDIAPHAQIQTEDEFQFYTCAGASSSYFGCWK